MISNNLLLRVGFTHALSLWIVLILGCNMQNTNTPGQNQVDPSSFPSADDMRLLFNARPGIGRALAKTYWPDREDGDPYRYFNTMVNPKTVEEDLDVKEEFTNVSSEHFRSIGLPDYDDAGHPTHGQIEDYLCYRGEAGGMFEPIDRTLEVPLDHVEKFSPDYLQHLNSTFFKTFHHWRIHVLGYPAKGEPTLTLYKDATLIGNEVYAPGQVRDAITEWQQTILDLREQRDGARLRSLRLARHLAPKYVAQLAIAPVVLVAAFNHCHGDTNKHSFWIMRRFGKEPFGLTAPKTVGGGTNIKATRDGHVAHHRLNRLPIEIQEYAIPADGTHELVFRQTSPKPGATPPYIIRDDVPEFRITLSPSELLTDDDARRMLGGKSVFLLE